MDPFEVRVRFTEHLKHLGASRDSILKVAAYALEHFHQCDDLFNCILEQMNQANLRDRLNLLYLFDALCNISIQTAISMRRKPSVESDPKSDRNVLDIKPSKKIKLTDIDVKEDKQSEHKELDGAKKNEFDASKVSSPDPFFSSNPYIALVEANLANIIDNVVPKGPNGTVNLSGTRKVLSSWRNKNIIPADLIHQMEDTLKGRQVENVHEPAFSRNEIFRRIEEDRERHKRMKEENWIQSSDPNERSEFDELYNSLDQPNIDNLFDTLEKCHLQFLYDTTTLGNSLKPNRPRKFHMRKRY
ncbi:hypothetical protein DSO57_1009086 [Entomophthora muscae]|uniref:Uncharacterized protein n=1 Tax=Entomophthora muscae TaxID=34485 RepID=A0ACC2S8Z3_9FUNG|nr:hypothetical protein DSO57_1009086 [Entomophthora muscae]